MAVLDPFDYVSEGNWDDLLTALEAEPELAGARDENGISLLNHESLPPGAPTSPP